jgi:hypothetical protein
MRPPRTDGAMIVTLAGCASLAVRRCDTIDDRGPNHR